MNEGLDRLLFKPDMYAMNLQAFGYLAGILIVTAATIFIVRRERGGGAARELIFLHLFTMVFWMFSRGMARFAVDPEYIYFWYRSAYFYIPAALVLMYHYVTHAIGMIEQRRQWLWAGWIAVLPLTWLPVWRPEWLIPGVTEFRWGYEPEFGWMGIFLLALVFLLASRCILDVWMRWQVTDAGTDEGRRVRGVGLATAILTLATTDFLVGFGVPIYPLGIVVVPLFFVIVAIVSTRFGLVDITASVAADRIMNVVHTAILVVDRDQKVRVANPAAAAMLKIDSENLVDQKLSDLFTGLPDFTLLTQMSGPEQEDREFRLTSTAEVSQAEYGLRVSSVLNSQGDPEVFVCLLRDLVQEKRQEKERLRASLTDPLTGLPGRVTFLQFLNRSLIEMQRGKSPTGMLFIGIDRFKAINQELSFAAGDVVLSEVADRLARHLGSRDFLARVGGDEFAVVLESGYSEAVVRSDGAAILGLFEQPVKVGGQVVHVSLSIGAAIAPADNKMDAYGLSRNAARALQAAKESGRHCVRVYDEAIYSSTGEIALETQIRRGLENQQFLPHYQPIYDLSSKRIVGFEALARWQHTDRGLLGAYEFIEFAENSGLISRISEQVQTQVFKDMAQLCKDCAEQKPYVSINVSDHEFRQSGFVKDLTGQIANAGLSTDQICLELTERMVMLDPGDDRLATLGANGFRLFIDDFGTGYSSMSRLHTLPLDVLKIDRQFVMAMGQGESGERLIAGIIQLAKSLGLSVVAEGVSTEYEVERLSHLGCPYVQGFYFDKPMPFAAAREKFLAQ